MFERSPTPGWSVPWSPPEFVVFVRTIYVTALRLIHHPKWVGFAGRHHAIALEMDAPPGCLVYHLTPHCVSGQSLQRVLTASCSFGSGIDHRREVCTAGDSTRGFAAGNATKNVAPPPGCDCTHARPPSDSTMRRTIARPTPVPRSSSSTR